MFYLRNLILLLFTILAISANAQDLGSWNVYPSYSTVNSISITDDDVIYGSTLGGIFVHFKDGSTLAFSTISGMHRLDPLHSLYLRDTNKMVFSYSDGIIDLYDIAEKSFSKIEDISRVDQFPSKKINDIVQYNNEIFIATDFGIVVFDMESFFVKNSYLKLGSFERGVQVNKIDIDNDSIFVATQQGVAIADLSDNLFEVDSWINFNSNDGLASDIVTDIINFNSEVYAIANEVLFRKNTSQWELTDGFGEGEVKGLTKSDIYLGVLFDSKVVLEDATGAQNTIQFPTTTSLISFNLAEENALLGTLDEGIFEVDLSNTDNRNQVLLEGPYLNFFSQVDYTGNTLIGTSTTAFPQSDPFNSVRGYYLLSDGIWTSYNIRTSDVLNSGNIGTVYTSSSTSKNYYFGSWGRGVIKHEIETNSISVFNSFNSGLRGIGQSRSYVVISGLDSDSKDDLWAVSFDSDKPLNVFQENTEEWVHFNKVPITDENLYYHLYIDSNDQKWISLVDFSNNGKGLLVLDTKGNFDSSDDEYKKLTANSNNGNLPDELITEIIEDKNGEIWIGTARGIARFIFPNFIIGSTNPNDYQAQWLVNEDTSAISRFLLRDVSVTSIAVNEANQKWIGSVNQGIWVLNEDGSRIEKRITKDNSPLISNNILSITINDDTGEVFIATDLGLVSYIDTPISPSNQMKELKVFPNPFVYDKHSQILIEGLSEETSIKIVGLDGSVVQEIDTRGGRISWDGLDYLGNKLGTGIYFVVSLEKEGREKGVGKVVIIN